MALFQNKLGFLGKGEFKIDGVVRHIELFNRSFWLMFERPYRRTDVALDPDQLYRMRKQYEIKMIDGNLAGLPDNISLEEPAEHPCLRKGTKVIVTFAYASFEEQYFGNAIPLCVSRMEVVGSPTNAQGLVRLDETCSLVMRFAS